MIPVQKINSRVNALPSSGEFVHIFEADRRQGDDGHIQGVKDAPVFKQAVAEGAEADDGEEDKYGKFEMSNRIHTTPSWGNPRIISAGRPKGEEI